MERQEDDVKSLKNSIEKLIIDISDEDELIKIHRFIQILTIHKP